MVVRHSAVYVVFENFRKALSQLYKEFVTPGISHMIIVSSEIRYIEKEIDQIVGAFCFDQYLGLLGEFSCIGNSRQIVSDGSFNKLGGFACFTVSLVIDTYYDCDK